LRYSDRDVHPPAICRSIEFVFIGIAPPPDRDSSSDYPEIGASAYENSAGDDRLILMVVPDGDRAHNSFSGYSTIGRSEATNAQTPSLGLVQNLNPDFNTVRIQAIMEIIQCMASDDSLLALLA
jgi:hypothetical protein